MRSIRGDNGLLQRRRSLTVRFYALALPIALIGVLAIPTSIAWFGDTRRSANDARAGVASTLHAERFARATAQIGWHTASAVLRGAPGDPQELERLREDASEAHRAWLGLETEVQAGHEHTGHDHTRRIEAFSRTVGQLNETADDILSALSRDPSEARRLLVNDLLPLLGSALDAIDRELQIEVAGLSDAFVSLAGSAGTSGALSGGSLTELVKDAVGEADEAVAGAAFLRLENIRGLEVIAFLLSDDKNPGGVNALASVASNHLASWASLIERHKTLEEGDESGVVSSIVRTHGELNAIAGAVVRVSLRGEHAQALALWTRQLEPLFDRHTTVAQELIDDEERVVYEITNSVTRDAVHLEVVASLVAGLLFAMGIVSVLAARRLSRRVRRIERAATAFGSADRSARAVVDGADELGVLARSFNEMADNLTTAQERSEWLLERTVETSEAERTQLAADLHDGPVQRLTAVLYSLELISHRLNLGDSSGVTELVGKTRSKLAEEVRALRQMMAELRPPSLDERGLWAALGDCINDFGSRQGVACSFDVDVTDRLSQALETTMYRIVQEALVNVGKHAEATNLSVAAWRENGSVVLRVRDDGNGFDPKDVGDGRSGDRFGLTAMRERARLVGGSCAIESTPGTGTMVTGVFPVKEDQG